MFRIPVPFKIVRTFMKSAVSIVNSASGRTPFLSHSAIRSAVEPRLSARCSPVSFLVIPISPIKMSNGLRAMRNQLENREARLAEFADVFKETVKWKMTWSMPQLGHADQNGSREPRLKTRRGIPSAPPPRRRNSCGRHEAKDAIGWKIVKLACLRPFGRAEGENFRREVFRRRQTHRVFARHGRRAHLCPQRPRI